MIPSFSCLGIDCPTGMEYQTCSWEISCDEFGVVRDCRNSTCQSGCFCSNGYVLEDGVCVHPDMCTSKEIAASCKPHNNKSKYLNNVENWK